MFHFGGSCYGATMTTVFPRTSGRESTVSQRLIGAVGLGGLDWADRGAVCATCAYCCKRGHGYGWDVVALHKPRTMSLPYTWKLGNWTTRCWGDTTADALIFIHDV